MKENFSEIFLLNLPGVSPKFPPEFYKLIHPIKWCEFGVLGSYLSHFGLPIIAQGL